MAPITVNLYATLRGCVGGSPSVDVSADQERTVREVLDELGVPADQARTIFVNNRAAELSLTLHGGERVDVFPALGGG